MKSNWTTLKEKIIQDNKEGVCEWLRKFRKYPHTPIENYLEFDSEDKRIIDRRNSIPEEYAVSLEDLKKYMVKGVE